MNKGYEIRITCNSIPGDAKKIGDFELQQTQGWETPCGTNHVIVDTLEHIMDSCKPLMEDRFALVSYLERLRDIKTPY